MPGLLTKLKIRAFALVDKGACYDPESGEGSHILLAKHAEPREIGKRTFEEIRQGRDMMVAVHDMYEMFGDFSTAVSSALYDDDVEDREGEIRASMEQFTAAVDEALPAWLEGRTTTEKVGRKISAARLARLRSSRDVLEEIIREAEGGSKVADTKETKKAETPTVEELQAQLAASEAKLTEAEGKLAKQAAPKAEEKVDPLKDLPEPVRKHVDERITAAEGKASAAEQESVKLAGRIAELEKADKRREFRKIAETDLATWPGTVDEKIEEIEKLHEKLGREDAEKQIKKMAAVAKLSGASPLFKVLGGDGDGAAGGAIEIIRKRVDEACAKDVKLTRADAYTKVLREDPEMHKQYNEERGAA